MEKGINPTLVNTQNGDVKFFQAIEQAGDIVFITDAKGVIEYVNPTFEEVTGYAKEEVFGKTPNILKSGMMTEEYYQQVWNTILSGKVMRAEVLDRKKNGELFHYDQTISPLKDTQGNITHFVSTGRDVTRRKRVEQEVQLLLDLIQSITAADSFGAAVATTLKLVCETMNWDFGEVWLPARDGTHLEFGKPYYSKIEDVEGFLKISSQFTFKPGIGLPGRVWASGQAAWIPDIAAHPNFLRATYATEAGFKTAIGIPVMTGNAVVAVLEFFTRTERSKDERMISLSAAITTQLGSAFRRKQEEEILKKSEARLREAQRIAKLGNWELDLITGHLVWSDEIFRIFEIDQTEFGASYEAFLDLIHPEDRAAVNTAYTNSLKTREPYEITHRLLMSDGRVKYVEEHGENFYTPDGVPSRSVGTVQDITERILLEEEQRTSEEKFKAVFDEAPIGIALINSVTGQVEDANPAYARITGRSLTELKNLSWMQYTHPDDIQSNREYIARMGAGQSSGFQMEKRYLHPDGSVTWINLKDVPLKVKGTTQPIHLAMTEDITERKEAEEALRASEEQYRMILQTAMDGYWLVDMEGRLLDVNESYCQMSGYTKEELLAMSVPDVEAVEDFEETAAHIRKIAVTGEDRFETRHHRKDGSIFDVEISVQYKPMEGGQMVVFLRDITKRKQSENELRRWAHIFEHAEWGVTVGSADGKTFELMNPAFARMHGYTVAELEGQPIFMVFAPEVRDDLLLNIHQTHEKGHHVWESIHIRKDGSRFPVLMDATAVYDEQGRLLYRVVNVQDITERKLIESQKESALEALRESEQNLRMIFETMSEGIALNEMIWNEHGEMVDYRVLKANPAFYATADYQGENVVGRLATELYGLSQDYIKEFWKQHKEKNSNSYTELYSPINNLCFFVVTSPFVNGRFVTSFFDITDRKRAEEALRLSEEKYRTVADFTYDWEAWRGPDGKYVYVSPACERITGYPVEEFLADPDLVVKIVHPNDLPILHDHRYQVAHQRDDKKPAEFEYRIITASGETRWLNHTCVPVYGKNGEFLGRRENNRDVTDRKMAEIKLRDSEQRLREIVDAAPFGAHVYQLNEAGQLVFVDANESANQILGVDNSAFVGKTFEEAFPYLVRSELPQMFRRVANQGIRYNAPRFNYKYKQFSAVFEIHAIQIAPGRVASFFRNISEIDAAYDETIVGWSRAMDLRDKETEEHTERVTNMSVEVARIVGFSESELLHVRWGALLHDIGKIGIPDSILLKPGKLTEEEQALMRKHPDLAYQMLVSIHFLRPALDIPYCHHEKWDGTGYPRGLKGTQIPLMARIFSLVDVWDALRSDRPYRKKWPKQKTIEHIRSLSGTHFDPALIDVFLEYVGKKKM